MDKYLSQLLDEIPESTLHDVAQNIMDEPIPEEVKRRLLKPLLPRKPRPSPAPRPSIKVRERKRKAIVREFNPNFPSKALRTTADYQTEILNLFDVASNKMTDELAFRQTPFAIGIFLRGWQMDVPKGHPLGADPKAFLEGLRPQTYDKLEEEIRALNGIKFRPQGSAAKDRARWHRRVHWPSVSPQARSHYPTKWDWWGTWQSHPPYPGAAREVDPQRVWVGIDQVESLWLDIARYQPLRGGSYIPLPREVQIKKVVINVKNKDDHCLRWALRSALNPATHHVDRPSQYPTLDNLNFKATDAPIPIFQIPKVEKQNNLAINVFGWKKGVIIHHLSKQPANMPRINLLLIENAGKFHYTWIKDTRASPGAQALLWAMTSWLQQRRPAGVQQARVPRDQPDRCEGGDARRGWEQASLPEPP